MALPHQDAAHRHQRRRAQAIFFGAQHGGDDDVAAGLQAAIGAQHHLFPETIQGQHLMHFRQPHLPRDTGIFDAGLWRGAGAAGVARDQDHVGLGLGDASGNRADARARHQLHAHLGVGVDLLQVVNQLRQIFDRINIVMRRRGNQSHARRRVAQLCDQGRHLDARQLPAFARLGALRHLDLQLAATVQVFCRHAKPSRCHLLDGGGGIVAVGPRPIARGILAALAGIGFGADAVHGDRQGLMRFRAECAERDAGRHQTLPDFGDRFHVVDRHRCLARLEVEQIAQIDRRRGAHALAVFLVGTVGFGGHGLLQGVDQRAFEGMGFAAAAIAIKPAHRQGRYVLVPGLAMQLQHFLLDAGQADAGDARGHAGEIFRHQRAAQTQGLEVVAAAIGADHRNAHLGHDFQHALVERLLVVLDALLGRQFSKQPTCGAVQHRLFGQICVDRGGAGADQYRHVMHVEAFRAAHVERGEGAQRLAHQMRVDRARRQDHRNGGARRSGMLIRQDHMQAAAAHAIFGFLADARQRIAQRMLARFGITPFDTKAAIDLDRGVGHVFAHGVEFGGQQHRRFELQQFALVRRFVQDVAEIAQPRAQRHDATFS